MTIDRLFRTRHECDKPTRILTVGVLDFNYDESPDRS